MTEPTDIPPDADRIHDEVRDYYRSAAQTGDVSAATDERWGVARYDDETLDDAGAASELSMGCGNPFALADLAPGETVLDLGSGGGIDVILSAKRVAPTGKAYGIDFLDEMIEVANANAAHAGVGNVEFLKGMIEDVPLPDGSVDVVISNCVINLAPDKRPVFAEIARVLRPGGRVAISDVVADDDHVAPDDGAAWADCGAGALRRSDYVALLGDVGLTDVSIEYTHDTGPGLHGAAVRARRPSQTGVLTAAGGGRRRRSGRDQKTASVMVYGVKSLVTEKMTRAPPAIERFFMNIDISTCCACGSLSSQKRCIANEMISTRTATRIAARSRKIPRTMATPPASRQTPLICAMSFGFGSRFAAAA